jgi:hypothetical protein
MSFVTMFSSPGPDDDDQHETWTRQPPWFKPEDELGAPVPLGGVIARSERSVVALSQVVAHSSGVSLEFLALARGLKRADANRIFHEQHLFDEGEPSDTFLRIGLELADGTRVSNLGGHRGMRRAFAGEEPDGPILMPNGGGGGNGMPDAVSMRPGYWLWPLPPAGALRVWCEWPALEIPLSSLELDADAIREAAQRALPLWPAAPGGG